MEFYYIGNDDYVNRNMPKKEFQAVEMNNKGKTLLYPVLNNDGSKIFISGYGWIKKGKCKTIPVFPLKEKEWTKYRMKYRDLCMFYSLTGEDYNSNDAAVEPQRDEYTSLCLKPERLSDYKRFVRIYRKINEIQKDFFTDNGLDWTAHHDCLFTPLYYERLGSEKIPITFDIDVIGDDKKIGKVFILMKNSKFKNRVFPENTIDKIIMIYGERCANLYEENRANLADCHHLNY